jgi:hypothetical protein
MIIFCAEGSLDKNGTSDHLPPDLTDHLILVEVN